jgi:aminobenzoyl-glutamate utilization protein A
MCNVMKDRIIYSAVRLRDETVRLRRDFHKYPEGGFFEFRTASVIIKYLQDLGYAVRYGKDVVKEDAILGIPAEDILAAEKMRAISEGADPELCDMLDRGKTAVVATLQGKREGDRKVVAFRFDIDSNEITESVRESHLPMKYGFRSVHDGFAHACGHDGHTAIGLTLARILKEFENEFSGTVKLIFQPAEEGVRGAEAMVAAGVVDDVDYFFSGHLGLAANKTGMLYASTGGFLCASKFDAAFIGKSAHAGNAPQEGNNALLAAAQASLALHAISRHGDGASRVNVGVLNAGTGRNIIPDNAIIKFETRGETEKINDFMIERAKQIVFSAGDMYNVKSTMDCVGRARSFEAYDSGFASEIYDIANDLGLFNDVSKYSDFNASEDCTSFMSRVCELGGKSTYLLIGSDLADKHHTPNFDFDEDSLTSAAAVYAILAIKYAN